LLRFETVYAGRYERAIPGVPVEAVTWRLSASGPPPALPDEPSREASVPPLAEATKGERPAYFPALGGFAPTPVYDRERLRPGMRGQGPAVIEEREAPVVVGPRDHFQIDGRGNVVIAIEQASGERGEAGGA
ncbi:MAG TPA: hydantoinase/oxoprolinase family protein, partial [Nitrolancea sp.]|nr:hydantoinase/oxoprolinase family protein [Nitrolancea sp.]